jgi:hypothetical protein
MKPKKCNHRDSNAVVKEFAKFMLACEEKQLDPVYAAYVVKSVCSAFLLESLGPKKYMALQNDINKEALAAVAEKKARKK